MKSETKRSVTAVLLAAAMLLSTQGITAFADTEKIELPATEITQTTEKPETPEKPAEDGEEGEQEKPEEKPAEGEGEEQEKPEEKPAEGGEGEVQEKPETETPETPADPSAVAPAALETANTDIDFYDFIGVPADYYFTYSSGDVGVDSVYCTDKNKTFDGSVVVGQTIRTQTSTLVFEDAYENVTTFTVTTKPGYKLSRLYGENVTHDGSDGVFEYIGNNQYKFQFTDKGAEAQDWRQNVSFSLKTEKIEYEFIDEKGNSLGTATIGNTISLEAPEDNPDLEFVGWYVGDIKLEGPLTEDIIAYADENNQIKVEAKYEDNKPFWTFNADENGSVKWNDKEPTNSIVFTKSNVLDLKHDNVPDYIYAVPKNGYGFAGWSGTGSDNFKGTSQVSLDNPSEDIIINATAKFNPLVTVKFDAGDHGALDPDKSTRQFASDFNDLHGLLTSPSESDLTIDEGWRFTGWTLTDRGLYSEDAFIEFYEPLPPINEPTTIVFEAQYEKTPAEQIEHIEINLGDNLRKEIPFTPIYLHAEYDGDYIFLTGANKHFTTPPVSSIPDTLTTDVDDPTKAQEFFSGFTCLGWNFAFDKHYISNAYISEARVEGTTLYMTLDIPAPEAPANINELLDVTLNCENPDHPVEYGKSKTYSDLLPNSYTIGEVKNNDGTYTCDITINPEEYLADYNNVTKTNHILVTTPENLTGIATVTLKYEDGAWKTAESPVTFTVTCKQSIPLTPSKPSDDVVKAIMDKISVTVDCTNTTGHDPMNHTLTGAEFTVGDIYSVAPFAGKDPVILCPVTINNYVSLQNGFITQYNAATNESHTLSSGFIPASIVLTYNKDAQDGKGAWENHDLENITLSLTCNPTTPGGGGEGTNPGGNGGDNDDDDDRYTGGNTVTRTINDDDVPLNDRPTNTTTIDDEDVPLADLPDDTVTIDDGEVPLKANPSTGDSLPFAAMAAAALSLGGVIVLNRKKK